MPPRRAVFILNPAARGAPSPERLGAAIERSGGARLEATIWTTEQPAHATALAREAEAAGADIIFACGGDGTINEVLNGLSDPRTQVGLVPAGTANVWAKEAGVPRDPVGAIAAQLNARPVPIDLGRAGERRFLLMASLGLDAATAASVSPRLKRLTGGLAYVVAGARTGALYRGHRLAVGFDDGPSCELAANMVVIGNTRLYGGVVEIAAQASAVDGQLDCIVFRGAGPLPALRSLSLTLLRRHLRSGAVLFRRAREIRVEPLDARHPLLQVDGDVARPSGALREDLPARFTVEPRAVTMLVPKADRPVFQPPRLRWGGAALP